MAFLKKFVRRFLVGWLLALYERWKSAREVGTVLKGEFRCRITNPDGTVEDFAIPNAATTVGHNSLLNVGFRASTQITAWYIGLINGSGYSAVSASDTMASHSGWTEYTAYTETTRQQWSPAAASGGVVVNSSAIVFTNGGSAGSIQGMFLASSSTKSETASTLYSTAVESSPRSLAAGATFQVYYQVSLVPVS
jgi:hypothetical protein